MAAEGWWGEVGSALFPSKNALASCGADAAADCDGPREGLARLGVKFWGSERRWSTRWNSVPECRARPNARRTGEADVREWSSTPSPSCTRRPAGLPWISLAGSGAAACLGCCWVAGSCGEARGTCAAAAAAAVASDLPVPLLSDCCNPMPPNPPAPAACAAMKAAEAADRGLPSGWARRRVCHTVPGKNNCDCGRSCQNAILSPTCRPRRLCMLRLPLEPLPHRCCQQAFEALKLLLFCGWESALTAAGVLVLVLAAL